MRELNVVIAESDAATAQVMAARLHTYFRNVAVARSVDELRRSIPKHRADVAVIDLEMAQFEDIRQLRDEFGDTRIVCTHRIPDEQMWTDALDAGAEDVCYKDDVNAILHASGHHIVQASAA